MKLACRLGFLQLINVKRFLCVVGGIKALSHSHIKLKCLTGIQECYFFLWRAYHV